MTLRNARCKDKNGINFFSGIQSNLTNIRVFETVKRGGSNFS